MGKSLLLIFPLFLIYSIGVVFLPVQNGTDFVSRNLLALVGDRRDYYILLHVGLATGYGLLVLWRGRWAQQPTPLGMVAFLLECSVYAASLGAAMVLVPLHMATSASLAGSGEAIQVILSLGAGVYEELIFRLAVFALLAVVLRVVGIPYGWSVAVAMMGSALAFAVAHHLGPHGDPIQAPLLMHRFLAGMAFSVLFYFRSLAHAAYTHTLYDLGVLGVRMLG